MNLSIIENIIQNNNKTRYETQSLLINHFQQEGYSLMQASIKAEENKRKFIDLVNEEINYSVKENIGCLYLNISSTVTNVNLDFFKVNRIYGELQNLTWQEFEDFCAGLMKRCFGASSVEVTQRTADMGLDFKGFIPFKAIHSASTFSYIELFGQAKKYAGNVSRGDVDAFTAFANRQKRDNTYPAQLFIFCTTSDFIPSAKSEIIKNNFVPINGRQIATLVFNETNMEGINAIKQFI